MKFIFYFFLFIVTTLNWVMAQSVADIYLKKIQDAKNAELKIAPPVSISPAALQTNNPVQKNIEKKEVSLEEKTKFKIGLNTNSEFFTLKTTDKSTNASSTILSNYSYRYKFNFMYESDTFSYGIFYEYHPFEILPNGQTSSWLINNRKNIARNMGGETSYSVGEKSKISLNFGIDDTFFVRTINSTNLSIDMFHSNFLAVGYALKFHLSHELNLIPEFKITNNFSSSKDTYAIKNSVAGQLSILIEKKVDGLDWQLKSLYGEKIQESDYSKDHIKNFGIGVGLKINF